MKLLEHDRIAWNHEVKIGNQWTIPVSDGQIQEAKKGNNGDSPYYPIIFSGLATQ